MPDYTPHTEEEIRQMLEFLGLSDIGELFQAVPEALRLAGDLDMSPGLPEPDVLRHIEDLADENRPVGRNLVCFAGGGAYDHEVPPVVRALAGRSEFVTSYTPYQPEVAQGVLQAVFEFQTMIARLTGMDVSNASLYDGASAVVEALNLGVASSKSNTVWMSDGVNPRWRSVAATFASGTGHDIRAVPLKDGLTDWEAVVSAGGPKPGVLVVAYPNYLGCLEDVASARSICDESGAILVVAFDPVASGILKTPGSLGADVVVGEGQAFGTALSFGGPYLGLFACTTAQVRRLPGRLVGETVDTEGRKAYVTTLRAREQDIRREKATSNVCTNQTLMSVYAAVQLGWLGTSGLAEIATRCAQATDYTRRSVLKIPGIEALTNAPLFREFAVALPISADVVIDRMIDEGFLAGISIGEPYTDGDGGLLISATERRTRSEIDAFATALQKAVR